EKSEGATASQEKRWLIEKLERDLLSWKTAWKEYVETMRPPSQAELNACFVPKGKAWRALTRQAASLDQRIDKKMRLYWDTQKKDRERIVRQYEEAKLEATAEEVAAAEARRAASAGCSGGVPTGEETSGAAAPSGEASESPSESRSESPTEPN